MPEKKTLQRAKQARRRGKRPTTQAGEFVHEEVKHIRRGQHGARSTKQAIAIGLSKARRAGVPLEPPTRGTTSERTRRSAERAYEAGQGKRKTARESTKRSRAVSKGLKRESRRTASSAALSRQAKRTARRKSTAKRKK